jgi:hypothetical protein
VGFSEIDSRNGAGDIPLKSGVNVAAIPNDMDAGVPLRLYYQLKKGHAADAEVIARASLAFIAGVKELSYILDPSLTVRVGMQGHADGSLWEDLLLLVDKAQVEYRTHHTRYGLALAAIAWLLTPPLERARDIAWEPILSRYMPEAKAEDVAEAKSLIERASTGRVAVQHKQQFYREIGRDTHIIGVSANIDRAEPFRIVPQADFAEYSGRLPVVVTSLDRTTIGLMRVIILSPVLEVSDRRWKFATAQGEFGASVKDRAFLERIVAGQTAVRMRGGVELDVELETKERLIDGVWTITERNVIRVADIIEPAATRQGSMFPKDRE